MSSNKVKINEIEYNFQPLKLRKAIGIAQKVALIATNPAMAQDDDLYNVGKTICAGLLADDFEVNYDEYFTGKITLLGKVVLEGMKINFPDMFENLGKLGADSELNKILDKLESAKSS